MKSHAAIIKTYLKIFFFLQCSAFIHADTTLSTKWQCSCCFTLLEMGSLKRFPLFQTCHEKLSMELFIKLQREFSAFIAGRTPSLVWWARGHQRRVHPPGRYSCHTPCGLEYWHWQHRTLVHSIQQQAICDHKDCFLNIYLALSMLSGTPGWAQNMYRSARPPCWYVIGDGGYSCLIPPICLMTPYGEPDQNAVHLAKVRCWMEVGLRDNYDPWVKGNKIYLSLTRHMYLWKWTMHRKSRIDALLMRPLVLPE